MSSFGRIEREEPLLATAERVCKAAPCYHGSRAPAIQGPWPARARPLSDMPSNDAKWIIGTLGALLVALGGILIAQNASLAARVDRLETRDGLDMRLGAVEVALGQIDQRMAALERIMLPAGE